MDIDGATALVTGSNRGLGRHFAAELVQRGAKVYATARRPDQVDLAGVEVLALDITDQASVEAAADRADDVDLLINNAAFILGGDLITGDLDAIRATMDSNYYGTLAMVRAFAPVLAKNGGGAILNVLSSVLWTSVLGNTSYAAAKSAQWGLTNGIRLELADQGTHVAALIPGMTAKETMKAYARDNNLVLPPGAMNDPAEIVRTALDGLAAGEVEILDRYGVAAKASLAGPPAGFDFLAPAGLVRFTVDARKGPGVAV